MVVDHSYKHNHGGYHDQTRGRERGRGSARARAASADTFNTKQVFPDHDDRGFCDDRGLNLGL